MNIIRSKKINLSMDLAPLIDVVFQLLVFFMLTSTFANPAIKLFLPSASTRDQTQQERIVVHVDHKGAVFINDKPSSIEKLEQDLIPMLNAHKTKAIHIKGDQDMPYKYFVEVMDLARQAGALQVNIVHQKK